MTSENDSDFLVSEGAPWIDAGIYRAKCAAIDDVVVEPFPDPEGKRKRPDNGDRWEIGWDLEINGETVRITQLTSRIISDSAEHPSTAFRILSALGYSGGKPRRTDYIGRSCLLSLGLKKNGYPSFDAYTPIKGEPGDAPGVSPTTPPTPDASPINGATIAPEEVAVTDASAPDQEYAAFPAAKRAATQLDDTIIEA